MFHYFQNRIGADLEGDTQHIEAAFDIPEKGHGLVHRKRIKQ